jgi:hypothetical protein
MSTVIRWPAGRHDRHCCGGGSVRVGAGPGDSSPSCFPVVRWLPVPAGGGLAGSAWYLRSGLSYRDVEELLAERGIEVDHVTIYRWVQRPALIPQRNSASLRALRRDVPVDPNLARVCRMPLDMSFGLR